MCFNLSHCKFDCFRFQIRKTSARAADDAVTLVTEPKRILDLFLIFLINASIPIQRGQLLSLAVPVAGLLGFVRVVKLGDDDGHG